MSRRTNYGSDFRLIVNYGFSFRENLVRIRLRFVVRPFLCREDVCAHTWVTPMGLWVTNVSHGPNGDGNTTRPTAKHPSGPSNTDRKCGINRSQQAGNLKRSASPDTFLRYLRNAETCNGTERTISIQGAISISKTWPRWILRLKRRKHAIFRRYFWMIRKTFYRNRQNLFGNKQ